MERARRGLEVVLRVAELRRDRVARRMAKALREAAGFEARARCEALAAADLRGRRTPATASSGAASRSLAVAQSRSDDLASAAGRHLRRAAFASRDAAAARARAAGEIRSLASARRIVDVHRSVERRALARVRRDAARRASRRDADIALDTWAAARRSYGN